MAEEIPVTKETPTLPEEEPTGTTEVKPDVKPANETELLIAELERAGVSTVSELDGKLTASREAGNLANQLGTARGEIAELKAMIANQQVQTPASEKTYGQEETDLDSLIGKAVKKEIRADRDEQTTLNRQAQQSSLTMWNAIQNDPDYDLVKEVWEEKTKNPNFGFKVQQGLLNPYKEFTDTVREYYKGIAKRSVDTIKQLQGKGETPVPHIEEGGRVATNLISGTPSQPGEVEATLKEKRDKAEKGKLTYEDELDIVGTLFKAPKGPEQAP